jgi:hypothetical protein
LLSFLRENSGPTKSDTFHEDGPSLIKAAFEKFVDIFFDFVNWRMPGTYGAWVGTE